MTLGQHFGYRFNYVTKRADAEALGGMPDFLSNNGLMDAINKRVNEATQSTPIFSVESPLGKQVYASLLYVSITQFPKNSFPRLVDTYYGYVPSVLVCLIHTLRLLYVCLPYMSDITLTTTIHV